MWFLGHFAIGYFVALGIGRVTREKINIPLVWFFSILPDLDLFIPGLQHRGPTHSVVIAALFYLPILLTLKRGLPYFAAVASHSMIGDYINPPVQMLWPISNVWFEAPLRVKGATQFIVEIVLFSIMVLFIIRSRARTRAPLNPSYT